MHGEYIRGRNRKNAHLKKKKKKKKCIEVTSTNRFLFFPAAIFFSMEYTQTSNDFSPTRDQESFKAWLLG